MSDPTMSEPSAMDPASAKAAFIEYALRAEFSKDLGLNLGGYILGLVFDTVLLGILCHQVIHHITYAKNDRLFIKLLLVWIITVTTATSFCGLAYIFHLFVYGFGVFVHFAQTNWLAWFALLDVLVTFPCQAFYLERAYSLNKNAKWIPTVITPIMLASLGGGIWTMVVTKLYGFGTPSYVFGVSSQTTITNDCIHVWLSMTLAADAFITALILYGLWRNRTGWSETDRLISKLVRISIQSQLPSTVCALGFLINYSVAPASLFNGFWELWHPKCYVVSLLAVLNMRSNLHRNDMSSAPYSSEERSNTYALSGGSKPHQATVQLETINIATDTYQESHATSKINKGLNRELEDEESGSKADAMDITSRTGLTGGVAKRSNFYP